MMSVAAAREQLRQERREVRSELRHEYFDKGSGNPYLDHELQNDNPDVQHVYGGQMSGLPQEGQIVQAWRPTPWGEWQLAKGIIHRVHHEDRTVTVQFVPDQHRVRTGFMSVKPLFDITPEYPEVRLAPDERLPTRSEILEREHRANVMRQQIGLPADAPLPGTQNSLRAGEMKKADGTIAIRTDKWGIPAPTLDALRNRSIPPGQVTGEYGRHYYTNLYKNNFYLGQEQLVAANGRIGVDQPKKQDDNQRIISHHFIPLEGPEMEQDLRTGQWYPIMDEQVEVRQPDNFWMKLVWFLG